MLVDRHFAKTGEKFNVGDRIEYIHVLNDSNANTNAKQGDAIELFQEHEKAPQKFKIDYLFYVDKQISNPCMQLFELFLNEEQTN